MSEISSHVRFFPAGEGGAVAPDKLVNHISEGKGKGKRNEGGPGVIWVNFLLGMYRWPRRTPTPFYSLFCGQI